jgi:hypothetical protein
VKNVVVQDFAVYGWGEKYVLVILFDSLSNLLSARVVGLSSPLKYPGTNIPSKLIVCELFAATTGNKVANGPDVGITTPTSLAFF